MNICKQFGLVSALLLGLSIAALAADASAASPAKRDISQSDRWYSLSAEEGSVLGYLHMAIKPSGDATAPVRVVYQVRIAEETVKIDSLCVDDEWLSPISITLTALPETEMNCEVAVTPPDPKSGARTMTQIGAGPKNTWVTKEHVCVVLFAPPELLKSLPFDKDKHLDFAQFKDTCEGINACKLSYAGKEAVELNGRKRNLHKFNVKVEGQGGPDAYWLTDQHELARARIDDVLITPGTEAEARKPVADAEAKQAGAGNAETMSEAVAGCGTIRAALRVHLAQYNVYPTLDEAAGDQLEATLHITPAELESKNFKAADYVVTSTPKGCTIKATHGAQTYVIDEKGVESGTFRTK